MSSQTTQTSQQTQQSQNQTQSTQSGQTEKKQPPQNASTQENEENPDDVYVRVKIPKNEHQELLVTALNNIDYLKEDIIKRAEETKKQQEENKKKMDESLLWFANNPEIIDKFKKDDSLLESLIEQAREDIKTNPDQLSPDTVKTSIMTACACKFATRNFSDQEKQFQAMQKKIKIEEFPFKPNTIPPYTKFPAAASANTSQSEKSQSNDQSQTLNLGRPNFQQLWGSMKMPQYKK